MSDRAVVRLTLDNPGALVNLRDWLTTAVVVGMPDAAVVQASHNSITLSAFLDDLRDWEDE